MPIKIEDIRRAAEQQRVCHAYDVSPFDKLTILESTDIAWIKQQRRMQLNTRRAVSELKGDPSAAELHIHTEIVVDKTDAWRDGFYAAFDAMSLSNAKAAEILRTGMRLAISQVSRRVAQFDLRD